MSESVNAGNLILTPIIDTSGIQAQVTQMVERASAQAQVTVRLSMQGNAAANLSGLEFQILGLTDAVKMLGSNLDQLGQRATQTGSRTRAGLQGVDLSITEAARSVRTLLTEFNRGGISAGVFNTEMSRARAELTALTAGNSLGTRELQLISSSLNTVAKVYGEANTAASPYLVNLREQKAAQQSLAQTTAALNSEVLQTRRAWQEGSISSEQMERAMASLQGRAQALLAPLAEQKAAILALGVPTREESVQLERITLQMNGLSLASQRAAAGIDAANNRITRGSLAAGVQAGTAGLSTALKTAVADTERLMNAERAGLITKEQYILGLAGQTAAHRAALLAAETEAKGLLELGVLDAQQTARLEQLTLAQNGYTAALARTVAAQEAQAAAQRAAAGAALGLRGAGGMNNLAMGAMFVSPTLGMAAMAAQMGPVVAGALAVGLLVKSLGEGIDKAAVFQRSLQQIGAISGESADEMNHFGSFIQELSTELPISTQHLAEMGREAVMVGLHGPEGMRVYTETMAAFSVITRDANGNLGHTAEVGQEVVKILRSTGATTEEVTRGFGRMINGLVGLKTESGVAIPQVTALLKFWSSQGHAVGLTIEQMTGLSAALIQTGARAQGAGGAMAKFFDTAESAAATGGKKLQSWADVVGLSAERTRELIHQDPMEFLTRFVTGAERMDRQGRALSLTLGSVGLDSAQVRRTMAELNNALPLVTGNIKIMTEASQDQGLALRKAVEATSDYKDKVQLLSNGFDVLKTNMGMAVLPGMTAVLSWALDLSKTLQHASEYLSGGLGGAMGIDTTKLTDADKADVELTLKRIDQIRSRTDSAALAEMDQLKAHLAVLKSIADGSLVGTAPWLKTGFNTVGAGQFSTPIGVFNGTGPLASGQVRGASMTEAGVLAIQASLTRTGDKFADSVVDYCARWVRETLGKASPKAQTQINRLFQTDFNGDGKVTAIDASRNADKAGILRKYTKATDLAPGDTVFYTEGGQNHVGLYIGNGMVRGNNRISMRETGNPVGDVGLNRLGTPTGFVRAADYLGSGSAVATDPARVSGPNIADLEARLKTVQGRMTIAGDAAGKYAGNLRDLQAAALLAAHSQQEGSEDWNKAIQVYGSATSALKGLEKGTKDYVATRADFNKFGSAALQLIKDQERATKSGSATEIEAARGAITRFQARGQAAQAVFSAEQAAYTSRQQARQKADQQAVQDQRKQEQALKTAAANQLAADQALADGRSALAKQRSQDVLDGYANELKAADGNAGKILAVEQAWQTRRLSALNSLSAAEAQAQVTNLEQERNKKMNAEGVTSAQRQSLWSQYADRIAQVDTDLKLKQQANALEVSQALTAAQKTVSDAAAKESQATYDAWKKNVLDRLASTSEDGLIQLYSQAAADRDLELITSVMDELDKRVSTRMANDFVKTLTGTAIEQAGQITDYLSGKGAGLSPDVRKGLEQQRDQLAGSYSTGNPYAAGYLPGGNGFEGGQSRPEVARNFLTAQARGEALVDQLGGANGEDLRSALDAAAAYMADDARWSVIGQSLQKSIQDGLTAAEERYQTWLDSLRTDTQAAVTAGFMPDPNGGGFKGQAPQLPSGNRDLIGLSDSELGGLIDQYTTVLELKKGDAETTRLLAAANQELQQRTRAAGQAAKDADLGAVVVQVQGLYDGLSGGGLGAQEFAAGLTALLPRLQALAELDPGGAAAEALKMVQGDITVALALASSGVQELQTRLEAAHAAGEISQAGYISERQRLAEEAARVEFRTRTQGLVEGTPAYVQAERTLQSALTAAAAQGSTARKVLRSQELADAVTSAQRVLTVAQRDGGDTSAPRAAVSSALAAQIAAARTELAAMSPLADGYQGKLTAIWGLEDQLREVKLGATLTLYGFDTGLNLLSSLEGAGKTFGTSMTSHFAKVAEGSESMSAAVAASLAEMTVNVVDQLAQQVIATEAAALATDLLSGNWVKAGVDLAIIGAVAAGDGLFKGLLTPGSAPTIQNPSSGTAGSTAASAASSAPAIQYNLTLENTFHITEGLDSPGTRQKLAAMQEQTALQIMSRAGLVKLPAASPVTSP